MDTASPSSRATPTGPGARVSRRAFLGVVAIAAAGAASFPNWLATAAAPRPRKPVAHRPRKPVNHRRPVISDRTPSVGQTIHVTRGKWS